MKRVCAMLLAGVACFISSPLGAAETGAAAQEDAILAAVVRAIVKARDRRFCVGVSRVDHGWQGPWEMPSARLQGRLVRSYRNVGFPEGPRPCYSPFYLVGAIKAVPGRAAFEVTVMDLEHPDPNGPDHYSVRRNWLGKWKASQNCCKE